MKREPFVKLKRPLPPAEGVKVNAFPIFQSSPRPGGRKTVILWPIFRRNSSPADRQFALWPLFERRVGLHKKVFSIPFFSSIKGSEVMSFAKWAGSVPDDAYTSSKFLLPFYFSETVNKPPRGAGRPVVKVWGLAPFYGRAKARVKDGVRSIHYILPPFFRYVSEPDGASFGIWPFFKSEHTDEHDRTSFLWPLFSSYSGQEEASHNFLWPLYREEVKLGQPLRKTYMGIVSVYEDYDGYY